jgi:CRISPR type IV-associated protein Csf3
MAIKPIKITFILDGTGFYYDPAEPLHLDALLAWALCPMNEKSDPPKRDEVPDEIPVPLGMWRHGAEWGWTASALFPDGDPIETIRFWRKKFNTDRAEMIDKTVNTRIGATREYNVPMPLVLAHRVNAWALGDRKRVAHALRKNIRYLGKKRSQGIGKVRDIIVEWTDEEWFLEKDGAAMRHLPMDGAARKVRTRPPYWNNVGRVPCCEVGGLAPEWARAVG